MLLDNIVQAVGDDEGSPMDYSSLEDLLSDDATDVMDIDVNDDDAPEALNAENQNILPGYVPYCK